MLAALSQLIHLPCSSLVMASSSSLEERLERIQADIRIQHLQQLQMMPMSKKGRWTNASSKLPSYYHFMEQWSTKAREQIHTAIKAST
jgi:hypothetical protein